VFGAVTPLGLTGTYGEGLVYVGNNFSGGTTTGSTSTTSRGGSSSGSSSGTIQYGVNTFLVTQNHGTMQIVRPVAIAFKSSGS
jgi:hypothetical protein